ncbi:MAG: bifunctional methylenetetrahydrofolate dehydrogenase/methenyltetrahydrofolate cyclohydrolase, partial [SAR202 cluster bacterium]|nr:bifunctional methylenetetrahydrofolate dehydrogenase/methenyltetrahydrofolate cyclohydrolase [SAR202 cluster bacterium]
MANSVRAEIADCVAELTDRHGVTPGLAVVLAGDDPASMVYVRHKERAAIEARMISQIVILKAEATEADVL